MTGWEEIPEELVPRHKISGNPSLALKVYEIIHVDKDSDLKVEWNDKGQWESDRLPG